MYALTRFTTLPRDGHRVYVWDRVVRYSHWSFVVLCGLLFFSGEIGSESAHSYLSYLLLFLISLRITWGFIGSHHARFTNFTYHPRVIFTYLKSFFVGEPRHYLGHNPAGGIMVFVLISLLTIATVSGLVTQATIEFEGPLVSLLFDTSDYFAQLIRQIHQFTVEALFIAVGLHLIGVVTSSLVHHENLVSSMIHGYKRGHSDD